MKKPHLLLALLAPGALALAAVRPTPSADARPLPEAPAAASAPAAAVRLAVAPTGNQARYLVRERLAGVDFPNDAVGETGAVTGAIVLDARGAVVPAQSKITVDLKGLKSDKERRDGFVQNRLLETEKYPTVELVPTAVRGLSGAIPTSGSRTFEVVGNLTVKGVTRPTTWRVNAQFQGNRITGRAWTAFTFADFSLTQPRVPVVLSVADTIGLEWDFTLLRQAQPGT